MGIRIACPHCGVRALEEFAYGEVFTLPESITDPADRDLDRGFMHDNIAGPVREAWFHVSGCRRWIHLERDTETDEIIAVEGDPSPGQTSPSG